MSGENYYKPREIVNQGLIVNSKGKQDYGFVLRLIKNGDLKSVVFNEASQIKYNLVSESEIAKYNNRFSS